MREREETQLGGLVSGGKVGGELCDAAAEAGVSAVVHLASCQAEADGGGTGLVAE